MTRHNVALIELYFDGNAKGPQACRLFSSLVLTSGARPVVPVRRRSSILRCSCFTQSTHMVDWRFVNHKEMSVVAVKMSCP